MWLSSRYLSSCFLICGIFSDPIKSFKINFYSSIIFGGDSMFSKSWTIEYWHPSIFTTEKIASARVVLPIPPKPCNMTTIAFCSLPHSNKSTNSLMASWIPTVAITSHPYLNVIYNIKKNIIQLIWQHIHLHVQDNVSRICLLALNNIIFFYTHLNINMLVFDL